MGPSKVSLPFEMNFSPDILLAPAPGNWLRPGFSVRFWKQVEQILQWVTYRGFQFGLPFYFVLIASGVVGRVCFDLLHVIQNHTSLIHSTRHSDPFCLYYSLMFISDSIFMSLLFSNSNEGLCLEIHLISVHCSS